MLLKKREECMIEEENKQLEAEGETKKKAIEEEKNQSELEAKEK